VILDSSIDARCNAARVREAKVEGQIVLPVWDERSGTGIGVLQVEIPRGQMPSAEGVWILERFARAVGEAIADIRRREARKTLLEKLAKQAAGVTSYEGLAPIAAELARETGQGMGADTCAVRVWDAKAKECAAWGSWTRDGEAPVECILQRHRGVETCAECVCHVPARAGGALQDTVRADIPLAEFAPAESRVCLLVGAREDRFGAAHQLLLDEFVGPAGRVLGAGLEAVEGELHGRCGKAATRNTEERNGAEDCRARVTKVLQALRTALSAQGCRFGMEGAARQDGAALGSVVVGEAEEGSGESPSGPAPPPWLCGLPVGQTARGTDGRRGWVGARVRTADGR
jgi:hypothetical protein